MKMKFNSSSLIFLCLSTLLFSCTKDRTKQCDIDPSYSFNIAPFFNTYCVACHQSNSSSGGVNLDNFESVSNHIDQSISEFRDGTMPSPGSLSPEPSQRDSILELLNCWVSMGKKNN